MIVVSRVMLEERAQISGRRFLVVRVQVTAVAQLEHGASLPCGRILRPLSSCGARASTNS